MTWPPLSWWRLNPIFGGKPCWKTINHIETCHVWTCRPSKYLGYSLTRKQYTPWKGSADQTSRGCMVYPKDDPYHPRDKATGFDQECENGWWIFTSWWLNQPIWKICASQIGSFFPGIRGENSKKKKNELPPPSSRLFACPDFQHFGSFRSEIAVGISYGVLFWRSKNHNLVLWQYFGAY